MMSLRGKIFHSLVGIAFLICAFKGAEAMLFWIPKSWGTLDGERTFTAVRTTIAVLFALVAGVSLVVFLDRSIH